MRYLLSEYAGKNSSEVASEIDDSIHRGHLVSEEIVRKSFHSHMEKAYPATDWSGGKFFIEGVPRTKEQAVWLIDLFCCNYGLEGNIATVEIKIEPEILASRRAKRKRADDVPETNDVRMSIYESNRAAVNVELLRNTVHYDVYNNGTTEELKQSFIGVLSAELDRLSARGVDSALSQTQFSPAYAV